MVWAFLFILIMSSVYCKPEDIRLLSTNGYLYVKQYFNLSMTCQINKTSTIYATIRFIPDSNMTAQAAILANRSTSMCTVDSPYTCDVDFVSNSYTLSIPHNKYNHKQRWACAGSVDGTIFGPSNESTVFVIVPVTKVDITPTGTNNVVDVVEGENQTFTCVTGISRPAAWIQWYIGGRNVTYQANPQLSQVGDNFTSSSILVYFGNDTDHNKSLHCEAVNVDGEKKVVSLMIIVFIKVTVKTVKVTTTGNGNVVDIIEGDIQTFVCTTGSSRPAAWIQWYIEEKNLTNQAMPQSPQQDGDKFISCSTLMYTGIDSDHNKSVHCETVNIEGEMKITSAALHIMVKVPVKNVAVTSAGNNSVVNVVEEQHQKFTCTAGPSRPAAWIQWYIGERNVTNQAIPQPAEPIGDKFISSSILEYTGNDTDHNKSLQCGAVNIERMQEVNSTGKLIYIKVKPKNIKLEPSDRYHTIRETKRFGEIKCSASCRPECKYYWNGPNYFIQNNSTLILESIYRNESGMYSCYGTNEIGNISSGGVEIEVYYPPYIINLQTDGNSTIAENMIAVLQCEVDSNPKSNIEWKFLGTETVVHQDIDVLQSNFTIKGTNCSQTGLYECQATNIIDNKKEMSTQIISFSVQCGVRVDNSQVSTPSTIGVKQEDGLNITVYLIAVPPPVISWTFINNLTGNSSTVYSTDVFGDFAHVSNLKKMNMSLVDFGVYTMYAYNNIGTKYTRSITVIPQRPPIPPTNISVSCDKMSIKVTWKSEFNGGDTQIFRVIWWENYVNEKHYGRDIPDTGEGTYPEDIIRNLQTGRLYLLRLEAKNSYGNVLSNELVNCTTSADAKEESNTAIVGAVVGTAVGLVVILLIVGGSFVIRRRIRKGKDTQPFNSPNTDVDSYSDELRNNPMYVSSGPKAVENQKVVYSVVSKVPKQLHDANDTYAVSQKCKSGNNKQSNGMTTKKSRKDTRNTPMEKGCEYENSNDIAARRNDIYSNPESNCKKNHKNMNKDGLVYADLELRTVTDGKRFVIKGLENRINYADIDLAKRADPLPDTDSDEEHNTEVKLANGED